VSVPLALLLALSLLAACERGRDRAAEHVVEGIIASQGRESKVEIDREHGAIRVDLGPAIRPAGWPDAVPIDPHAERAKVDRREGGVRWLSVASQDSSEELRAFYRDALGRAGWQWRAPEAAGEAWTARRGEEEMRIRFAERARGGGSRAEIEYRGRS
jgi:hypothetical protein